MKKRYMFYLDKKKPILSILIFLFLQVSPLYGKCPYGDAIIVGSIGECSNLIPILAPDSASHEIASLVYDGLLKYDKNLKLIGNLAKSWNVSSDGQIITFKLRQGVRWHDGHPFTAKDVLFTYQLMVDPHTPTPYAGDFMEIAKAEAPDDFTFRVYYKQPFAPGLASWTISILPKHLLSGKDITKSPLIRHPIGTGPYRFKEWVSGQKIILEYNPDYFNGRPCIDWYISRVIPDMATMFLELKAGGIDYMGLTPLQYKRQTDTAWFKKNFKKYRYLAASYTYLGYNLQCPLFRDKRVRQAISYAINKQEIVDGVLLGLGVVATGPYKPDMWAYNPHVRRYSYNPEKAKKLLAEVGWQDTDGDGILDKDGHPFMFTIITNQGNSNRLNTAQIIQYRLGQIGIKVKIRVIEWTAFIKEFINKRRFEATILGWTIPQGPDLYDVWHSSKDVPGGLNFIGYHNKELDKLIEEGRHTFNLQERKRCYFRIQEILAEEQPYTFLYVPEALPIIHLRFHGIEPAPAGISYNFIRWYVPQKMQRYSFVP